MVLASGHICLLVFPAPKLLKNEQPTWPCDALGFEGSSQEKNESRPRRGPTCSPDSPELSAATMPKRPEQKHAVLKKAGRYSLGAAALPSDEMLTKARPVDLG